MHSFHHPGDRGDGVERADGTELHERSTTKALVRAVTSVNTEEEISLEEGDPDLRATGSTAADAAGMQRMGKDQQLVRHFRLLSITSFVALATLAWEIGIFLISPGLIDGGRAGLIYNCIWNFIGFGPVYLSMAEMASMAPIVSMRLDQSPA